MSDDIKVGDLCIVLPCNPRHDQTGGILDNIEVIVVGDESLRVSPYGGSCFGFLVQDSDCQYFNVARPLLRKKPPTQQDDAAPSVDNVPADPEAWDLTHWHPNKIKTEEPA